MKLHLHSRKTLLAKYFYICSSIILISISFLGAVLLIFASNYFSEDKYAILEKNVRQAVAQTNQNYRENSYNHLNSLLLEPIYRILGNAIDADIFLVEMSGRTLLCSDRGNHSCEHGLYLVPADILKETAHFGIYRETGRMGGIYTKPCYTVGMPVKGADGTVVGVVFASASAAGLTTFLSDIFQMFVISATLVMLFSFIIIYFITSNLVRPLQEMLTATQSFSHGDFSVRVPVEGDDEVAMLASAFNSMASSLAIMEQSHRSFTANVSHELKTPMTTIGGFIDGILDGTIPPHRQREYLQIVSSEVQRLSRLVRSMLSISRIEAGEMQIVPTAVEITDIITRTLFIFEKSLEEKNIRIEGLEAQKHLVQADADLIHQVVYNLIDNAVKFVNSGGLLEIAYHEEGGKTSISIKNSGEGISPEEISRLFDRFYKTDKSRSLDKNGVGLGLYIVKTLINLQGGEIFVRSQQGHYTQFTFSLPTVSQKKIAKLRKQEKSNQTSFSQ